MQTFQNNDIDILHYAVLRGKAFDLIKLIFGFSVFWRWILQYVFDLSMSNLYYILKVYSARAHRCIIEHYNKLIKPLLFLILNL